MPEDSTLNSLRLLSKKKAGDNQGALIAEGGIFTKENVVCTDLVAKGKIKVVGDMIIAGRIHCPYLEELMRNVSICSSPCVPIIQPICNPMIPLDTRPICTPITPVAASVPLVTKTVLPKVIDLEVVNTDELNATCTRTHSLMVGRMLTVDSKQINMSVPELNIVNPHTSTVNLQVSSDAVTAFVPIYRRWDSFIAVCADYDADSILHCTCSEIVINVGKRDCIDLCLGADEVPDNTRLRVMFVDQDACVRLRYRLELIRFERKTIFQSDIPVKKIKLMILNNQVYLL